MDRKAWASVWAGFGGLALGTLYRFPPDRFPFYPACPFYRVTGLLCPGCGATRALAALLHGNLAEAWHRNALFVLLLPLVLGYAAEAFRRVHCDKAWPGIKPATTCVLFGAAALFTVLRNL